LKETNTFDGIVSFFRQVLERLLGKRTGRNTRYEMIDAALSAFSVFFTQNPSFLSYQKTMVETKGRSNAQSLYCHQPLCEISLQQSCNFILVYRPESHTVLYEHLQGIPLPRLVRQRWTGKVLETYTYRYLNQVPLRDDADALLVNWCELTVSRPDGKVTYKNAFATNHLITEQNLEALVVAGRTRWKVENENNNTLRTKGYNLEHNFGHGKKYLSSFLDSLNILSLLFHTLLELLDDKYQLILAHLPTRI